MKKIKLLVITLLLFVFVAPFVVNAEEADTTSNSEVKVYLFRGEGCGYCAKALEFFESIEEEYGNYYELITYEVWNDTANAELMNKVAEYLGAEVSGVPFIVIGETTYPGFDESWGEDIKENIMAEYNKAEEARIDVIKESQKVVSYDNVITVVSIVAIAGIIAFVYFARKDVENNDTNIKETVKKSKKVIVEEADDEEVIEEVAVKVTEKKSESKRVSSNKKEKNTTNTKKKTTSTNKKKKN